jgi:hypothetical protein
MMSKAPSAKKKQEYLDRLIDFANALGYDVELDSQMLDYINKLKAEIAENEELLEATFDEEGNLREDAEFRPSGDCSYGIRRIRVREGKGINGQISTLIHELSHALGMGGPSLYTSAGESYIELVCESVTQFVTASIGVDRLKKTAPRIINYGFGNFLNSDVTRTVTQILLDALGFKDEPQYTSIEVVIDPSEV